MENKILTTEMNEAIAKIRNGSHVFVTGKAGSGKTTFLRQLQNEFELETVVVAPTGIAAINAGGVTIHSQFMLPIGFIDPNARFEYRLTNAKKNVLKHAKILIIDEISMVRCDIMDAIDKRLRSVRKNKEPFGGMQIVMFGDMMQLPPVVTKDEEEVLSEFYDDFFFFNANVFKKTSFEVIEFTEVFRQKDEKFVNFLNNIRDGEIGDDGDEIVKTMLGNKENDKTIHLCAVRSVADSYNENKLGQCTHIFNASVNGDFNVKNVNCDIRLKIREGARVMITKNDTDTQTYYNGTLGVVEKIGDSYIIVLTDDGNRAIIEPNTWESYKYDIVEGIDKSGNIKTDIVKKVTGSCRQFPLTLAYAITIHKSQGLTFDNVSLHIKEIFQTGQLYTALSRCRTLENTKIDYPITYSMLHKNDTIENFINLYTNNNNRYGKI